MSNLTCPQCHSDLDDDFAESSGVAECPFCGADVAELAAVSTAAFPTADGSGPAVSLPPPPPKSQIQVIQATSDRRVFYVPGGRAGGIIFFALVWNGFMTVFTGGFMFAMFDDNEGWPTILGISAFISVFWLIGISMAIWAVKAKFERLFLMFEPQRLAMQSVLFGRKKMKTFLLDGQSRAELVESYQENDNPVYRIEVVGVDGTAKFGTALHADEKNWLVDRINEFLRPSIAESAEGLLPKFCHQCGAKLEIPDPEADDIECAACGHQWSMRAAATSTGDDIDDAEIPQPPAVHIDEQTGDHLRFTLPACSHPLVGWVIVGVTIFFGGIFTLTGLSSILDIAKFNLLDALFALPFVLGGLVPISIGLFFLRGRITVDITPDIFKVRYRLGLLGITKKLPTMDVGGVKVMEGTEKNTRIRAAERPRRKKSDIAASVVQAGTRTIPLTLINDKQTARYVTQLVRRQLRSMGVGLS